MDVVAVLCLPVVLALVIAAFTRAGESRRLAFIESYAFPSSIRPKLKDKYPHLSADQVDFVVDGLRDYFIICSKAGKKLVSMPSQAVDELWHEFILITRSYEVFCRRALGRFLHHTPAEAMRSATVAQEGIQRAWILACAREEISPTNPTKLPRLFALDAMLDIPDGFVYSLDCRDGKPGYCAGHIIDAGSTRLSTKHGGSSYIADCGGGCGGGCGGD